MGKTVYTRIIQLIILDFIHGQNLIIMYILRIQISTGNTPY